VSLTAIELAPLQHAFALALEVLGVQSEFSDDLGSKGSAFQEFILRFIEIVVIRHEELRRCLVPIQHPWRFPLDEQHYFRGVGGGHQQQEKRGGEDRTTKKYGNKPETIANDPPTVPKTESFLLLTHRADEDPCLPPSDGKVRRIVYGASSRMGLSPLPYRAGDAQHLQQAGQTGGIEGERRILWGCFGYHKEGCRYITTLSVGFCIQ
jgi:hypothetical protein